jgi:hypothetical protein
LNKKKNNEKRIEKTTFELIWITKQSDANLTEGKSKQNESNLKKKKKNSFKKREKNKTIPGKSPKLHLI